MLPCDDSTLLRRNGAFISYFSRECRTVVSGYFWLERPATLVLGVRGGAACAHRRASGEQDLHDRSPRRVTTIRIPLAQRAVSQTADAVRHARAAARSAGDRQRRPRRGRANPLDPVIVTPAPDHDPDQPLLREGALGARPRGHRRTSRSRTSRSSTSGTRGGPAAGAPCRSWSRATGAVADSSAILEWADGPDPAPGSIRPARPASRPAGSRRGSTRASGRTGGSGCTTRRCRSCAQMRPWALAGVPRWERGFFKSLRLGAGPGDPAATWASTPPRRARRCSGRRRLRRGRRRCSPTGAASCRGRLHRRRPDVRRRSAPPCSSPPATARRCRRSTCCRRRWQPTSGGCASTRRDASPRGCTPRNAAPARRPADAEAERPLGSEHRRLPQTPPRRHPHRALRRSGAPGLEARAPPPRVEAFGTNAYVAARPAKS